MHSKKNNLVLKLNTFLKKVLVYIYMPVLYMIISYLLIVVAMQPFYSMASSVFSLLIADEKIDFNNSMESIYEQVNVFKDIINVSEITIPSFGNHYANIKSERINLDVPLYFGDTNEILRRGVGHYSGSYFPGFGATILVAGHNMTHFSPLRNIEIDDIISVSTSYGIFEYQVFDLKVLHMKDETAFDLAQTEKEILILYTCYPFNGIVGITEQRLFVYANKISGPKIIMGE